MSIFWGRQETQGGDGRQHCLAVFAGETAYYQHDPLATRKLGLKVWVKCEVADPAHRKLKQSASVLWTEPRPCRIQGEGHYLQKQCRDSKPLKKVIVDGVVGKVGQVGQLLLSALVKMGLDSSSHQPSQVTDKALQMLFPRIQLVFCFPAKHPREEGGK